MHAIMLAAGEGSRIRSIAGEWGGKPLVRLLGLPLARIVAGVLFSSGARSLHVVVNPATGPKVEAALKESGFDFTSSYNTAPGSENGFSLIVALYSGAELPAVLSMCDHLYLPEHAARVASECPSDAAVCVAVDSQHSLVNYDEATKVVVEGGYAKLFSKKASSPYVDTGVFLVRDAEAILEVAESTGDPRRLTLNELWNRLIREGHRVGVVDVTGLPWTEVDDEYDYYRVLSGGARRLLEEVIARLAD